ncbi:hypothetical protein E2C01_019429 [Portunus trituberculatus]|uniref:Uncharacterized protein n=1 Tax=Portunus trituberculatus TaxID=210409 RepID=A0A5B7DZD6_PORTR|nr:hypothetical protein [Portunus trituberculatus]
MFFLTLLFLLFLLLLLLLLFQGPRGRNIKPPRPLASKVLHHPSSSLPSPLLSSLTLLFVAFYSYSLQKPRLAPVRLPSLGAEGLGTATASDTKTTLK